MASDLTFNNEYRAWLTEIKLRIRNTRIKAAIAVNTEVLRFYWELGADIVVKQATAKWGSGLLAQLSKDLMAEFPEMKGFSKRNLELIRQWYLFYMRSIRPEAIAKQVVSQLTKDEFGRQVVAQITAIPWGHNIAVITKCKDMDEALFYVQNTMLHNWSRSVLVHQIESALYQREGKSINNFAVTLPKPQSDLRNGGQHWLKSSGNAAEPQPHLLRWEHFTKVPCWSWAFLFWGIDERHAVHGTSARPAPVASSRVHSVQRSVTNPRIASHLHASTPFLSSTHAATERLCRRFRTCFGVHQIGSHRPRGLPQKVIIE